MDFLLQSKSVRGCLAAALFLSLAALPAKAQPAGPSGEPPFQPRTYLCYRTEASLRVDGTLDEPLWQAAPWTEAFVDIQGGDHPAPRFRTRAKMLWDDTYFYVAARLEEPDVWATLTERDTVIFYDNDFEVFIDPDGDTHAYYELEVNALETAWDLMLLKPYRDGGPAVDGWDIRGLEVGVSIEGTLNDPSDTDEGWTVELALPWEILEEAAPEGRPPEGGEQWRVNFSRVQWETVVEDGAYRKRTDPETGEPLPEDNWVWSPQGVVDMHRPERWGYVQFSDARAGSDTESFAEDPNERVKWALRHLYYRQRQHHEAHGRYAETLDVLETEDITVEGLDFEPRLWTTGSGYEIAAPGFEGHTVYLREDGRVWIE